MRQGLLAALALASLGASGCALAGANQDIAEQEQGITEQLYNSYPEDIGFDIQRTVGETCGMMCVKRGKPNPKTHKTPCLQWAHTCSDPFTLPEEVDLYASADAYKNHNIFPAYQQPSGWQYRGCGPQAIQNVLSYYGVNKNIEDIAPFVDTIKVPLSDSIATAPDSLANALRMLLNAWGDGVFTVNRISNVGNIRDHVRDSLRSGNPVVMLVNGGSHYQVATGLEAENYHVVDYAGKDHWVSELDIKFELGFPAAWGSLFTDGFAGYIDDTIIEIRRDPKPLSQVLGVDKNGVLRSSFINPSNGKGWHGPDAVGDGHLLPGAFISMFNQQASVWTGLTVDRNGALNVTWFDAYAHPSWQPPTPIGDPHLMPGGAIATFPQQPGIWTGLTVDRYGAMNVAWLDLNLNNGWQGPVAFGDPHLVPGAPVSTFPQQPGVWAGLTVDRNGAMNVSWLDLNLNKGWQGPVAFGDPHLKPGAPVSVFPQDGNIWAGLTVDRNGAMNVTWLDLHDNRGWQGPVAFGDAHLTPGAPVAVFHQQPTVWTGLTVDRNGALNVTWLDLNQNKGWQGPVALGDAHLAAGGNVAVFQQSPGVWTALTIDRNGQMNVAWLDLNQQFGWQGPVAFGDARMVPGSAISVFEQSPGVWAANAVDRNGQMNVAWLDLNTTRPWQGPVPFGSADMAPGAVLSEVTTFKQ